MNELEGYRYRGARALVMLHERELRAFLATWRRAVAWGVVLPTNGDHDATPADVVRHVLAAAASYLDWITTKLDLPDPGIDPVPDVDTIEAQASDYLEHLLERWRMPLRDVPEERFGERYATSGSEERTIETMLEHAVVHPMRHAFQLEELMTPN